MPLASIYRERTQGKLWIVALVVFLAGLLLLLYAEYLYTVHLPIFAAVIANFGGVIIASLGLGVIWELYLKRAFVEEIFDAAGISRQVHEAKLRGVTTDFNHGVDWVQIIDQAKQLDMMVYAANTWRNVHSKQLAALAARQGAKINLILPDPTIDSVIQELARRFNTPSDDA